MEHCPDCKQLTSCNCGKHKPVIHPYDRYTHSREEPICYHCFCIEKFVAGKEHFECCMCGHRQLKWKERKALGLITKWRLKEKENRHRVKAE